MSYGLGRTGEARKETGKRVWCAAKKERKEASSFTVFKDTAGELRWVLQSSNAFRDRDQEIVSTKALEADVERSEKEANGDYGPLRWWHVDGADLGKCDWRVVHGRTLIESGTFKSKEIGLAVKEAAGKLQVSIGFHHPVNEPDENGVFHTIKVFERSLLPRGRAANQFTRVIVKGDDPMVSKKEKLAALKALGVDPEDILAQAEATEKELDAQAVAFKEDGDLDAQAEKAQKPKMEAEEDSEEDPEEDLEEEEEKEADEIPVVGNMSVKEYTEMLTAAMTAAFAPLAGMLHSHDAAKESQEAQKEASERTALKEAITAQEKLIAGQAAALQANAKSLKEMQERLSALEGEQPRATKEGFRASQAPETVLSDEVFQKVKESHNLPEADPVVGQFVNQFLGIGQQ